MFSYRNIDRFKAFLDDNMKKSFDFNACISDLEDQYMTSGSCSYELKSFETRSGTPETISFEVKYHFSDDNWDENTVVDTEIIF